MRQRRFKVTRRESRRRSCIVYHASYTDSVDSTHFVRLKECCPYQMELHREKSGRLKVLPSQKQRMKAAQEKFVKAYREQVEISRQAGLSNQVMHTFQIYYGNNTVYSVMDYMEGTDYGSVGGEELPKTVRRIRAVVLERYHRAGFLYLDIKAENIQIIRESDVMVYLFDHDSVVRAEALRGIRRDEIACTPGFEAPEIVSKDVDNFVYHQNCFVGRRKELGEIGTRLGTKHLLFLHGIGGIGKTELAARYAYENRETYNTVLFLKVEGSFRESLCREDIRLQNFVREEGEEEEKYVSRKLTAMRACLSPEDLLILDNLDGEDELPEEFTELPCRILITTRTDYRDWNYPQMEVEELGGMEELTELFRAYNPLPYRQEDMEAVEDMIRQMECHTMLTELLAKNLRVSGMAPVKVRECLETEKGIMELNRERVRHRKDRRSLQASVQEHLKVLFHMGGLGEGQICLLENLSLFAGVRIERDLFLQWCGVGCAEALDGLIQRGWVEFDGDGKISLHQIVQDLIYGERKPGGEGGRQLVRSMTRYAEEKTSNRSQRDIRNRLCGIFGRRISGTDKDVLLFYLAYCENIRYVESWARFCLEEWERHPDLYKEELARICFLKGREALKELGTVECALEEERQLEAVRKAAAWFERAAGYKEEGQFLFSMGSCMSRAVENCMVEEKAAVEAYRAGLQWMERGAG